MTSELKDLSLDKVKIEKTTERRKYWKQPPFRNEQSDDSKYKELK
jgi:hypothetical protein